MALSIAVCIKPVPPEDAYQTMSVDPVTKVVKRENCESVINPLDLNALEAAVRFKEDYSAKVAAIAMAPPSGEINLRQALSLGADEAYLLSDPVFSGSDTLATSYVLAQALIKTGPWDLVLCGAYSSDGGTAHVPSQLGEWLGIPHFHHLFEIKYDNGFLEFNAADDHKYLQWRASMPLLLSVDRKINRPRYMTFRGIRQAKNKEIHTLTNSDLNCDTALLGLEGSPTKMGELHQLKASRQSQRFTGKDVNEMAEAIIEKLVHEGVHI